MTINSFAVSGMQSVLCVRRVQLLFPLVQIPSMQISSQRFVLSFITDSFLYWFLYAADNPNAELIAKLPLPDGTVEEVYKYTPVDDTPIVVDNPLDVLEKVEVSSLICCFMNNPKPRESFGAY